MTAALIGLFLGIFTILTFTVFKFEDKPLLYGLTLAGIGFLYVGYTWSDFTSLLINSAQAVFFLLFAYYGIRKNSYNLAAGLFLHGLWDLVYPFFGLPDLLPPHYDLFCMTVDFVIAAFILFSAIRQKKDLKA